MTRPSDPIPTADIEYRAARGGVALSDRPCHCLILSGRDCRAFLQNLISNDLNQTLADRGISALLLTAKGKIISQFFVYALPESYGLNAFLLDTGGSPAEPVALHLQRYRFRSQVKIETPAWGRLRLIGPRARTLLSAFFAEEIVQLPPLVCFQKGEIFCATHTLSGEEEFHLFLPDALRAETKSNLLAMDEEMRPIEIGEETLETLRIEAGYPVLGIDIDDQIFPVEAGLHHSVSTDKGCYPGQEVVARIETYGHAKRQLFGLRMEGEAVPKKSDQIFHDGKEVGWVTSVTRSPAWPTPIALGYLRTAAANSGVKISVEIDGQRCPAEGIELPFYRRSTHNPLSPFDKGESA
jgi:folate-binding protein YgfZ